MKRLKYFCFSLVVFAKLLFTNAINAQNFKAGAFKANITPKLGTVINGNFLPKYTKVIHDSLYAKVLTFSTGKEKFVFVVVDCTGMEQEFINETKEKIYKKTGILASKIMISATHAHSCGSMVSVLLCQADLEYLAMVSEQIVKGVEQSLKKLEPAQVAWGQYDEPRHVFNRRWFMKEGFALPNPFGGIDKVRMNPEVGSPYLLKPAGSTDPQVSFLAVKSLKGKWISLLTNYSLHYVGDFPDDQGIVSADYFGEIGKQLQAKLNTDSTFVGIMSNGTSGDINNMDFLQVNNYPKESFARSKLIANDITNGVIEELKTVIWDKNPKLKSAFERIDIGVRKLTTMQQIQANTTFQTADYLTIKEINWATKEMFQVYAYEQVIMADMPEKVSLPIAAIRIGDGIIGTLPAEIFAETGLKLKEFAGKNYFTIGLANDADTYTPPPRHFELGGYETWRCRGSYMEEQAEPKFVENLNRLIQKVKK